MSEQLQRSIVITGTSSGIGYATAKLLAERGFQVFGSVRSEKDANHTSQTLGSNFCPLIFDVTDQPSVQKAADVVRERLGQRRLFALINNAGIEMAGPLAYLPVDRFRTQLEVNLIGVLSVTQAFLPLLGTEADRIGSPGRIINISSMLGRLAVPFVGAYCASKFGLEGFSDTLRREMKLFGIDVIVVEPGAVVTPIWDKAEGKMLQEYPHTPYQRSLTKFVETAMKSGREGFPASKVAELLERILSTKKPKARYTLIPKKFVEYTIPRLLPARTLDYFMNKYLGISAVRGAGGKVRSDR
ncbi:MAG: SDR family oxidoreductase [Verrucomicrobia bacterium]|nr:SDR family oxidoreductase [Verrucomicrobiota bacterium]